MAETVTKSGNEDNLMAALAYFLSFVTGIVIYLIYKEKKNKYVLFHAVQSTITGVALMVLFMVLGFGGFIVSMIPVIGWIVGIIMMLLWLVIGLGSFALWIFMMYKAYTGVKYKLPFVGDLAEKHA